MPGRAAFFLDRDGVLNRSLLRDGKPAAPVTAAEFELLPGVELALQRIRSAGMLSVVVTNQPDLATGRQDRRELDALHARLLRDLALDDIRVCGHVDADNCFCRKPRPGLLLEAARELDIDVTRSYMVGDRWRDVGAAHAAGCTAVFIDYGYDEARPTQPYMTAASLGDAVDQVLSSGWASLHSRDTHD